MAASCATLISRGHVLHGLPQMAIGHGLSSRVGTIEISEILRNDEHAVVSHQSGGQ